MKNLHAVALGRLGGLKGGPARAASLTPTGRSSIARRAAHARWARRKVEPEPELDMRIRRNRWVAARRISGKTGADVEVVEQVLFMRTLKPWERLARGLMRSRLGKNIERCVEMTKLQPYAKFPQWKSETCLKRMLACAGALHVHGFMSDSERDRVQKRLHKWLLKNRGAFSGSSTG